MVTVHEKDPVRVVELDGGDVWRVYLSAPEANLIDERMTRALTRVFQEARETPALKAICLEGDGPNFSFGASVEEHLPDQVAGMLGAFHGLFRAIGEASVVVTAAVSGQCLGGGLELAAFCHRVFAAPDARLGQPEIKLGVFAPIGSLILPERVGRRAAEDLCLTGRSLTAAEALSIGLCDEVADDPGEAAVRWVSEHLRAHSASSLRHAVRAARHAFLTRLFSDLGEVERIYLEDLMATHDAEEGIRAFLQKREPEWRNA